MTAHPPGRRTKHDLDDVILSLRVGMSRAATIFGLLALLAGWVGIIGMPGTAASIAKLLCFISVVMFALLLTLGIIIRKDRR